MAPLADALFCSAADANAPGDRFADRHRSLAEKFGIPFVRLRPPIEGSDWNDLLSPSWKRIQGAKASRTFKLRVALLAPDEIGFCATCG